MALVYFIIHVSTLAGRTTYASEAEMKSTVAGTYTCYDGYKARYQLKVTRRDTVIMRWVNLGKDSDLSFDVSSWNPANGTFKTSLGTITVTNDGNLKFDGDIYEKGGSWSSTSSDSSYSSGYSKFSYESGATVLKIQDVKVSNNSSYTICTGTVKNTGSKTYKYIQVKGAFKDSEGNVIDTDWTYAAGSEGLAPDEATTFRLSVDKNYNIESCSVTLLDYE